VFATGESAFGMNLCVFVVESYFCMHYLVLWSNSKKWLSI